MMNWPFRYYTKALHQLNKYVRLTTTTNRRRRPLDKEFNSKQFLVLFEMFLVSVFDLTFVDAFYIQVIWISMTVSYYQLSQSYIHICLKISASAKWTYTNEHLSGIRISPTVWNRYNWLKLTFLDGIHYYLPTLLKRPLIELKILTGTQFLAVWYKALPLRI